MPKNTGWTTTSVPTDLAESIESFVNSKEGRKLGYTSKTGFIADALREKLDDLSGESKKQQTKLEDKMIEMSKDFNEKLEMILDQLQPLKQKIQDKVKKQEEGSAWIQEMLNRISSPEFKKQFAIEQEQKRKDIKEITGLDYVPLGTHKITRKSNQLTKTV